MKKITSNTGEVISFLVSGQRHADTAVVLDITAEGVIASDEQATVVVERLGEQVTVTEIDVTAAKKEAEKAIKDAEKASKEAEKAAAKETKEEKKDK